MLTTALVVAALVPPAVFPINVDGTLCHPTRLMVKMATMDNLSSLAGAGKIIRKFPEIGYVVLDTAPGTLRTQRALLSKKSGIQGVYLDRAARPAYTPNDELWGEMWHARTIKADLAWDYSRGSSNVTVAVIDTGVNSHPDLDANIWTNPGEIPNNGIDDDNNGYVDDVHGYDFAYGDSIPNDEHGHGSACSGLVAAVQDNTIGVTGVAPFAKIMCLKAAFDNGYFYDSNNVAAYLYAQHNGARVLSCSFFSDRVSQSEEDAINYCYSHNVLPVVAAGNDNSIFPFYPGAYENVIGVGASDGNNNRAGFSDYGSWVDVACPGVSLRTTTNSNGYTSGFAGTSGATPQVAGMAALLMGANPNLSNTQIRSIIEDTATALGSDWTNYGLINCEAAMRVAMGLATQVGKPPVVRYITPLTGGSIRSRSEAIARVYGRGFQPPRTIDIKLGTESLPLATRGRNFVDFALPNHPGPLQISVDGNVVQTVNRPSYAFRTYPLIEASSQGGGSVVGGFLQAAATDGVFMTASVRGDGWIQIDATFRGVRPQVNDLKLFLNRFYANTSTGSEQVYLYDWSSASYPYGSFTQLSNAPVPTTLTGSTWTIPNSNHYIDPDGTMYLRILTSNDVDPTTLLKIDQATILTQ